MLSNFCRDLAIGHLVNRFDTDDAATKSFIRETLFELSLCFARTKEQDGLCIAKLRDHLIIICVEMADVLAILLVFPPQPCSDLEPPENRVCFSMSDSISFDSSPSSEINTTTALRWSIHKPAARFINSSLLDEFSQREIIDADSGCFCANAQVVFSEGFHLVTAFQIETPPV